MQRGVELAGRYRLEEPLGFGAMGQVWGGLDLRLRRKVAVKILPTPVRSGGSQVTRFRREAEIAATLSHPGITTVFDIDEHRFGVQSHLFLVMELLRGRDLRAVVDEHPGGLPVERVVDLTRQVLEALAEAHAHGVVHRDIKPSNLFLLDGGRVKICDFGISRLLDATRITETGAISGTPLYMAPEQIDGGAVDRRTDLYAVGCVLYELLVGETWLDTGAGIGSVMYQHVNRAPTAPGTRRPGIPAYLDVLVLDLLAKRPELRPRDAAATLERLEPDVRDTLVDDPPEDAAIADREARQILLAQAAGAMRASLAQGVHAVEALRAKKAADAYATPRARELAAEHGVDLDAVQGTGADGRVRRRDVRGAIEDSHAKKPPAKKPPAKKPPEKKASAKKAPVTEPEEKTGESNDSTWLWAVAAVVLLIVGVHYYSHGVAAAKTGDCVYVLASDWRREPCRVPVPGGRSYKVIARVTTGFRTCPSLATRVTYVRETSTSMEMTLCLMPLK